MQISNINTFIKRKGEHLPFWPVCDYFTEWKLHRRKGLQDRCREKEVLFLFLFSIQPIHVISGVCKTRTGYLRMADADGGCGWKNADRKMRTVKGGWKATQGSFLYSLKPVVPFVNITETITPPFLLLRTTVKINMYSPLLEAGREVEN